MPPRSSTENDPKTAVETARKLQTALENAKLHIVDSRSQFDARTSSEDGNLNLSFPLGENGAGPVDPAIVSADVTAQLSYFRKLKFQYLEQKAKNQYIKIIVSDDAPNINAADNEKLRLANEKKKEALKQAKARLRETQGNIRTLAPLIEQDYSKAKALTSEATILAQRILDAKLQLIRLRQTHPQPRLTIPAANAQLDSQVEEMQKLDEQLQDYNQRIEDVKGKVKDGAREVERLRVERADVEKQLKICKSEVEDGRVISLYDWFTASLKLHQNLFSLESHHAPSENELHLTYSMDTPPHRLKIVLLFVPNTRRLADAQVEGLDMDIAEVVGSHVQSNDVPGLIAALLALARRLGER
ncbi:hypothetical protein K474DRAFT_1668617 [Panus rudis PR-1116 ss-1]|nr:hypothetical protein K474DRAFT_1668617 [Panus rudis PR-1116 ss-1]